MQDACLLVVTCSDATHRYESGTGWPSFYQALPNAVDEVSILKIPKGLHPLACDSKGELWWLT